MKRILALGILSTVIGGCDGSGGGGVGMGMSAIVASWVSAGPDVAPLLAKPPFNDTMITATFNPDSSYHVVGIDSSGKMTIFTGTFTSTASEVPGIFNIGIIQNEPSSAAAQGIYEIDPATHRMKYEVVQTQPTNGLTPPNAAAGFGSTVYNGKSISSLVQNYSRQ